MYNNNLELRMYTYENIHIWKTSIEDVYSNFLHSKKKLFNLLDKTGYLDLKLFIDKY